MATSARGRRRVLGLPQQAFGLRSLFPGSQITMRGRRLRWIGDLRPTELSQSYRTRIDYVLTGPGVTVSAAWIAHPRPSGRLPSDHWPVLADLEIG